MVEKALIEAFIVIVHNFKLRESSFPALLAAPNISVGGCCLTEANLPHTSPGGRWLLGGNTSGTLRMRARGGLLS